MRKRMNRLRVAFGAAAIVSGAIVYVTMLSAQNTSPTMTLTAKTENVEGAPDDVRIQLFRWSSDAERETLLNAWTMPALPERANGRGGGRGGGGKGRGGNGGAGGEAPALPTPSESLVAALAETETVGYLWAGAEVAGYSLKYAFRIAQNGGERIILITQRRLGSTNDFWNPVNGTASNAPFSVIELRLNAQGGGEGKASLTGGPMADAALGSFVLENYAALPVVFGDVATGD